MRGPAYFRFVKHITPFGMMFLDFTLRGDGIHEILQPNNPRTD